jgi:hypothetical protein
MGRAERAERAVEAVTDIRLAAAAVHDPRAKRRLRRAEGLVLRDVGPSVPKRRAAAVLGISVTALERWVRSGRLPVVRRPGGREEVDVRALLDVVEELRRVRDETPGEHRPVARAFARLAARGLPRRRLRPNERADDLRRSYLHSTPIERLRETAELSFAATTLAGYGARPRNAEFPPGLRFFDLLRVLRAHDVEFVVICGFALGFHGAPRATKDVDLVPKADEKNLTRLRTALDELEAEPQELEELGGGNWILHTRLGRLDVMQWVEPFESYDELRANAVEQYVDEVGASILVAGLDDLILMKETAGRDQDLIDVTSLRMAHGLEE